MMYRGMVKMELLFSLTLFIVVCCLAVNVLSGPATGYPANFPAQNCSIRGYVLDSYGTGVPGAEVRLLAADGGLCRVPDNPVLSGRGEPGRAGYFEYRGAQPGNYTLACEKDGCTGSVSIVAGDGGTYVELTLPGYVYVGSADTADRPTPVPSISATADRPGSAVATGDASVSLTEQVLPAVWRLALGVCTVIAGVLIAVAVLKKG